MGKSMKKFLLLAKEETTAGTDPTPTAALNAILCRGLMPSPIDAEFVSRDVYRSYKGSQEQLPVGVHRKFSFEVELAGSGTAGTAPKWGCLFKACGFDETIVAATSVGYAPVTSGEKTVTLYAYLDGVLFKLTYGKGSVAISMTAKGIPLLKFNFIGEYSDMTDATFPTTQDFSGFVRPKPVGRIFTTTSSVHGIDVVASDYQFDMAAALVYRDLMGGGGPHSPDRQPSGTAVFELTSVASKAWGATVKAGTTGAISIVHGTVAGNIATIGAPAVQFNQLGLQNQEEVAFLSAGFGILPTATGNDELTLTLT